MSLIVPDWGFTNSPNICCRTRGDLLTQNKRHSFMIQARHKTTSQRWLHLNLAAALTNLWYFPISSFLSARCEWQICAAESNRLWQFLSEVKCKRVQTCLTGLTYQAWHHKTSSVNLKNHFNPGPRTLPVHSYCYGLLLLLLLLSLHHMDQTVVTLRISRIWENLIITMSRCRALKYFIPTGLTFAGSLFKSIINSVRRFAVWLPAKSFLSLIRCFICKASKPQSF